MQDALARSIAQTAADVLGRRSDAQGGAFISDEAIGERVITMCFDDPAAAAFGTFAKPDIANS